MSHEALLHALAYERARADRLLESLLWVVQTFHHAAHTGPLECCNRVCAEARLQLEWVEP